MNNLLESSLSAPPWNIFLFGISDKISFLIFFRYNEKLFSIIKHIHRYRHQFVIVKRRCRLPQTQPGFCNQAQSEPWDPA